MIAVGRLVLYQVFELMTLTLTLTLTLRLTQTLTLSLPLTQALYQVFELIAATRNSNTFVALTLLVAVLYRGGG